MAHAEQMEYVAGVRARFPEFFADADVLEVGSRNVNGSVRQFFAPTCRYVGLDCSEGPGVDVVSLAHAYVPPRGTLFDTIVSCEAFEHDPYLSLTITNVMRYLRVGGLFVATMASANRPEHGTVRTMAHDGLFGPDPNYYRGVSSAEFRDLIAPFLERAVVIAARAGLDVYAHGFRCRVRPAAVQRRDRPAASRGRSPK